MQGDTCAVRQGQQPVRVMLQPLPQGGAGIGVSQNLGKKSAADGIRQISPAAGQQTVLIQAGAQPAGALIRGRVHAVGAQQLGQRRTGDALGLQQIAAQPARKTAGLRIILLIVYTMQAINGRGIL